MVNKMARAKRLNMKMLNGYTLFFVLQCAFQTSGQLQFTSKYQGKSITGSVGSSVDFTWGYTGGILITKWGLKKVGGNAIDDNGELVSLNALSNSIAVSVPSAYTGRVSGRIVGDSSSGQAIFTLSSIKESDENFYGCLIAPFGAGIQVFDYVHFVVQEAPTFTRPTQTNASYNEGSLVNISCTATGKPDPDVRWIYNGQEKSFGSKTAHLIFSPTSKAAAGTYTCRANNSAGTKEKQLHISVNYPATIEDATSSVSKSWIGQKVTLTCKSDGVPTPTLSWYKPDGTKFSPVKTKENAAVVTLNSDGDFGFYNCTADNGFAPASMAVLVQQIKAPGPPIITSTVADIQATSLTVKWTKPTDTGGSPITAYRVMTLQGVAEISNDNITDPALRSWPIGNLEINTNYTVKVFARNFVFEGNAIENAFQTKVAETCFPPWTQLRKRCYKAINVPSYRWKDASASCQTRQSHMVTISSEEENDFVAQLAKVYLTKNNMTQVQMWIGMRKMNSKGQFKWVDGSSLDYTNWSPGEPNGVLGRELCTEMLVSGNYGMKKWNDVRCDTTSYKCITVCEKPLREGD